MTCLCKSPIRSFCWIVLGFLVGGMALAQGGATSSVTPLLPRAAEADSSKLHVVFLVGEEGYDTAKTLPAFARQELGCRQRFAGRAEAIGPRFALPEQEQEGFQCTFVYADSSSPHTFPGLEDAVQDADLLFLSVRRRALPEKQLALIRQHVEADKPLVAIRTSSHAFDLHGRSSPPGQEQWPAFDTDVLGGRYEGDYGNQEGTKVTLTLQADSHPIMRGIIPPSFHSSSSLYRSRSLSRSADVLLHGTTTDDSQTVTEPVAWTNTGEYGRVFYTSLGHPEDFKQEPFRRMLSNAVRWALGREVPRDMSIAGTPDVREYIRTRPGRGATGDASAPTSPRKALEQFEVNEDVEMELVASEPTIHQPLELTFDHRGWLWVVQYIQYPYPEGVQITGYDEHMRAEFDTVPAPPPEGQRGADRITVLKDTDGNGTFDTAEDVITGLNITSSVAIGRGGIWVLSPPYLLFYPDSDGNGKPDGKPEVRLRGFGLQDTHAVANSLTWGPDGWLYGAQGSTTTSTVSSAATKDVHFKGQAVWRYHPKTQVFELFAEGGGNTWSVEFDSKGRLFSGTNAGVRGLHYKQGAYYVKSWGKHGALTNPYAFGFFPHMKHTGNQDRFTHVILIYEGRALPSRYDGKLIGVNPLQNRIQVSRLKRNGSTYETIEADRLVETGDNWFRPVDIKAGPDGALYVADWYDTRLTHVDPSDNWHRASGRIYRIKGEQTKRVEPFDLSQRSTGELIGALSHPNKWYRQQAIRLLGDRKDTSAVPRLKRMVSNNTGPLALEALWALHLSGGFDRNFIPAGLEHPNPNVRRWTVRLIGDAKTVAPDVAAELAELARAEPSVQVRSQLAATAKRLPGEEALPMIRELLGRSEDADDPYIPLQLWWALEDKAESHRQAVLALFEDARFWQKPLVENVIVNRLMQRYAMAGGEENLNAAARLLDLSPSKAHTQQLITGLQEGLGGEELVNLPPSLNEALQRYQKRAGQSDLALGLRQGKKEAVDKVLRIISDGNGDKTRRLEYIKILGEVDRPRAVPALLEVLGKSSSRAIRRATMQTLMRYDKAEIGDQVVGLYPRELRADPDVRAAALDLLASRKGWALGLLKAIDARRIDTDDIPLQVIQKLTLYEDPQITKRIGKHWPNIRPQTLDEKRQRMQEVTEILESGEGNPEAGRSVYRATCGSCHVLHGEGGRIGPNLTGYDRDNAGYMLRKIIYPSAEIREGYVNYVVRTRDGRTLSGFVANRTGETVTIRSLGGQLTTLPSDQIDTIQAQPTSIMPEGLLAPLSEQEVRDLFSYMASPRPSLQDSGKARERGNE